MQHRALIIEDDPGLAKNLRTFFENSGYTARTADSAEQALDMIDASRPDIILLDYLLPGMNGLELLAVLRARDPALKIVMITGRGSVEIAVEAMRLGASDFLTKPVALPKLQGVVANVLGRDPNGLTPPATAGTACDPNALTAGSVILEKFMRELRRRLGN